VDLEQFNGLGDEEAAALVGPCVAIDSFVDALVRGRPYADLDALLATAAAQTDTWTAEEVRGALADHPRIGDTPTARSRAEQAGVGQDDELTARLRDGNHRYEERFGHLYLVRASGRTGEEMLALLEQRLGNDPDTELQVTAEQLGEIALLRLEGIVSA